MATYLEMKRQIDELQREADALKVKERKEVIARMKEAIAAYEITAADLGLEPSRGAAVKRAKARQGSSSKRRTKRESFVAYADSAGNTWGGRGKRPNWLREALRNGARLEDFAAGKK
jgi:DNA-binding protein H-NS